MIKLKRKSVVIITLFLAVIVIAACNLNATGSDDANETTVFVAGDQLTYTAGLVSFDMVYVPGGITFPTGSSDTGSATVDDAYFIGETELTYGLWSAVYMWAVSNSYTFANEGREGHSGTIGGAVVGTEPVTTINWRDAMVWMNALTEYYNDQNGTNLSCVYRDGVTVIRDSRDTNAGECDSVTPDSAATGFRLMTSAEWELAARYINDDGDNILESGEYYPAAYTSGADAPTNITSGGSDYDSDGDTDYTANVAVYGGGTVGTKAVKSKKPNKLGLYSMNGNVHEWSFTLNASNRIYCGGGYADVIGVMVVWMSGTNRSPDTVELFLGFRVARSVQ
ncbi:MAG: SUMF1/EgtB/PvdO family nonheme iron enzyme [Clostridiales bacterium]|nr:SUMF1/EgtB/PvdO family nonheme iron enzyme [Clostridiales bacterium]